MLDNVTPERHEPQYRGSFQQLADARRVLKVTNALRTAPVLLAEDRRKFERIRAIAIRTIESATEELIATLDALHGDPDLELNGDELDGSHGSEDEFMDHATAGAGCPIADPAEDEHDREAEDGC